MLVATAADGSAHPVQLISQAPTVLSDERMDASQLERVLRRIHRRELFGRLIDHYELTPGSLVFHLAEVPTSGPFDLLILRREVAAAAAAHPGEWRVLTLEEARATALVPVRRPRLRAGELPGRAERPDRRAADDVRTRDGDGPHALERPGRGRGRRRRHPGRDRGRRHRAARSRPPRRRR